MTASGRLHPSSVFFRLAPHARALILPGLAVLLLSGDDNWQIWLMLMFVPSTIYELGQYFTLRYEVRPDELVVRSGLLWKRERRIPVARIHTVDTTQGPLQRMLGVADVRVETAGGSEPEAVLRVLTLPAVESLRAGISRAQREAGEGELERGGERAGDGAPRAAQGETLVRLGPGELVKLGVVSMRGAAAVAVLVGLAWEFKLVERFDLAARIETLSGSVNGWRLALLGVAAAVGLPALLIAVSIGWTLVRLWAFELVARGEDLRIGCGLLTRVHATVPRRRIQLVSVISSPVHRLFGRVTVRVETAGGSREQEEQKVIGQKWFVPLLPAGELDGVLRRVTGRRDLRGLEWRGLAPGAFRRRVKIALLVALALTAAVAGVYRPWGAASALVFIPLLVWHARADVRRTAYAVFDGGVAFRSGVVTRRVTMTFFDKVQVVSLDESPFDRRYGMATVDVDTAGGGVAGHRIRIAYLERGVAEGVYNALAGGAGRVGPGL